MIYWLRLFGLIFIFVCIVAGVGYVLPRSYDFEVGTTIKADPQTVFENIDKFPDWHDWSYLSSKNPNISFLEFGDDGQSLKWTDDRGKGVMRITETDPGKMIKITSDYGAFPEMTSELTVSADAGFTVVTWGSSGELPDGPFYGYFSPFFPNGMRSLYAESLRKLKVKCEREE